MADQKITVKVYHQYYGCDSGCCGHMVELSNGQTEFGFNHPYGVPSENYLQWAKEFAQALIEAKCPEFLTSIDWDSIDIDLSDD